MPLWLDSKAKKKLKPIKLTQWQNICSSLPSLFWWFKILTILKLWTCYSKYSFSYDSVNYCINNLRIDLSVRYSHKRLFYWQLFISIIRLFIKSDLTINTDDWHYDSSFFVLAAYARYCGYEIWHQTGDCSKKVELLISQISCSIRSLTQLKRANPNVWISTFYRLKAAFFGISVWQ